MLWNKVINFISICDIHELNTSMTCRECRKGTSANIDIKHQHLQNTD